MKKFLSLLFIFMIMVSLPVFAKKNQSEEIIVPMEQLKKREFQTRTYDAEDKNIIMKAILNVMQDEGYIVYNVNSLLGFIYGVKDFDTSDSKVDISKEFGLSKSRLNLNGIKVATIDSVANITQYDNVVRVRVNFKRKLLNIYGNAQFIDDVAEEDFYKDFYTKVDKAVFLLKQKL